MYYGLLQGKVYWAYPPQSITSFVEHFIGLTLVLLLIVILIKIALKVCPRSPLVCSKYSLVAKFWV